MRKKLILSVGLLACIGIAIGVYLYQKPRTTAASQPADFTVSAAELYQQFETNEAKANRQYSGKIMEVSGTVGEVQQTDSAIAVLLTVPDAMGGVNCSMSPAASTAVKPGANVTIKGKCAGFLMDVSILDAVVVPKP